MFNDCYGCTRRHVGCHAECESYKADKQKSEAIREKRLHESLAYHAVKDSNNHAWEMARKKIRRSGRK